jgi:hypothetical protein
MWIYDKMEENERYISDAQIHQFINSNNRGYRRVAREAMKARAAEAAVIGPKRPSEADVNKLLASAEPSKVGMATSFWDGLVGNDQRILPDGTHVWRNSNNVYSIDGKSYNEPLETYNAISNGFTPRDTDTNDNGGLGSDFFTNQAEMKKQEQEIRQLTHNLSNGDPTVNAAAQLFVGATGNVGQIGNAQPVGRIGRGGKRSRKYRKKKNNKKSKRRYRRVSGKSKV